MLEQTLIDKIKNLDSCELAQIFKKLEYEKLIKGLLLFEKEQIFENLAKESKNELLDRVYTDLMKSDINLLDEMQCFIDKAITENSTNKYFDKHLERLYLDDYIKIDIFKKDSDIYADDGRYFAKINNDMLSLLENSALEINKQMVLLEGQRGELKNERMVNAEYLRNIVKLKEVDNVLQSVSACDEIQELKESINDDMQEPSVILQELKQDIQAPQAEEIQNDKISNENHTKKSTHKSRQIKK